MEYVDIKADESAIEPQLLNRIKEQGLFWPVSTINGRIFYDGMLTLHKVIQAMEEERERNTRISVTE